MLEMKTQVKAFCICAIWFLCSVVLVAGTDWLDPYNVVWDSQSSNSAGSMPCGGRDIGLNVWVENNDILFYMQRSGSLAENNEYLKLGRVRLSMTPNPFVGGQFRQELKLEQGLVVIQSSTTFEGQPLTATVKIWTEISRSIIHVEIDANRDISVDAAYENWRLNDETIVDDNSYRRDSIFDFHSYPGTLTLSKDTVQRVGNGVRFYHRNPNNNQVPGIILAQQGLEEYAAEIEDDILGRTFGGMMLGDGFIAAGETTGQYSVLPYKAWHLTSENPSQQHHLRIVTHIDQTDTITQWENDLQSLVNASSADIETARTEALAWWSAFWDRSRINVYPESPDPSKKEWRAARNYNLFRYQLGCNAFGEYPTRFNGGNFTVDADLIGGQGVGYGPDWRDWGGGVFTAQNQRLVYWPMLKAGDFDAIHSQFELYRKSLGGARARVKEFFGHDGAVFSEYNSVPGVAIASGWGWESGGRARGTEIPFGDPRATGDRGYNSLVEVGVMANQSVAYHWESQLEHAYMMLEYHHFTGADISQYMPFIENAVIFFDEHYRLREKMRNGSELNAQGKLVIYPSTACETYRGAANPTDLIAGLNACLEGLLQLDDSLLSLRDKTYYQAFLNTIPDYPLGDINGHAVMKPAESYMSVKNIEAPHFYPLFPFNRFDLQGKDSGLMQTFRNTWQYDTTFPKNMVISWHQDGIFYARMAMTSDAATYNLNKLDDNGARRFPTFWGPGHDWVPDHNWGGSGMLGLQEMLMQTIDGKIYLFPAWPAEWDVDFKLHAPDQTVVEVQLRNGKIQQLTVTPVSRLADIRCLIGSEADFNADCQVDLSDFAKMAEDWLLCGLYPVSACP